MAAELLAGESSALYTRLYEQGLIDADFAIDYERMKGLAFLEAFGDSDDPEAVLAAILEEAKRLAETGIDREQFSRLKKSMLGREGCASWTALKIRATASARSTWTAWIIMNIRRHLKR